MNVNTLSKDGTQCQCYMTAVKKSMEFQGVSNSKREIFQSGDGSFYAPSAYASVMEAFVNPPHRQGMAKASKPVRKNYGINLSVLAPTRYLENGDIGAAMRQTDSSQ